MLIQERLNEIVNKKLQERNKEKNNINICQKDNDSQENSNRNSPESNNGIKNELLRL